jgi:glycosyltransferase 2 family protein
MASLIDRLKDIKTWVSFAVVIILFYILFSQLNIDEFVSVVLKANIFLFMSALVIFFAVFPLLALRWRMLLKNIGLKIHFGELNAFIFLQWFVNSIVPAKIGDLYKAYLVKKHHIFSMSKILGTIFVERLFDLIFIAFFSITSAFIVFSGAFPHEIFLPAEILVLLIICLFISVFFIKRFKKKIRSILPQKIKARFGRFEHGISKSVRLKDIFLLCIYSFLIMFVQISVTYLICLSIGLDISFMQAVFITMVSALVTIIPLTPAGAGFGEFAIAAIFLMIGIEKNLAISAAILTRATYWLLLISGGLFYIITKKK